MKLLFSLFFIFNSTLTFAEEEDAKETIPVEADVSAPTEATHGYRSHSPTSKVGLFDSTTPNESDSKNQKSDSNK